MSGRRQLFQNLRHALAFCAAVVLSFVFLRLPEFLQCGWNLAARRFHSRKLNQVVANEDPVQSNGGLFFLLLGDFLVQTVDGLLEKAGFVGQVFMVFRHFVGDGNSRLQSSGVLKIAEQPFLNGNGLGMEDDGLAFFDRNAEVAVFFELFSDAFPPFSPIIGDDVRHQRFLNLGRRSGAAEALDHNLDKLDVAERGHFLQALHVFGLSNEDMFGRNWL